MKEILYFYITTINIFTFLSFGVDKSKAKRNSYRISEKCLITLCICGGSVGGIIGMQIFHHKTKHKIFKFGIPSVIVLQYILILCYIFR